MKALIFYWFSWNAGLVLIHSLFASLIFALVGAFIAPNFLYGIIGGLGLFVMYFTSGMAISFYIFLLFLTSIHSFIKYNISIYYICIICSVAANIYIFNIPAKNIFFGGIISGKNNSITFMLLINIISVIFSCWIIKYKTGTVRDFYRMSINNN